MRCSAANWVTCLHCILLDLSQHPMPVEFCSSRMYSSILMIVCRRCARFRHVICQAGSPAQCLKQHQAVVLFVTLGLPFKFACHGHVQPHRGSAWAWAVPRGRDRATGRKRQHVRCFSAAPCACHSRLDQGASQGGAGDWLISIVLIVLLSCGCALDFLKLEQLHGACGELGSLSHGSHGSMEPVVWK